MIYSALAKRTHGVFNSNDDRGKNTPANKLDHKRINSVKSHIESFPRMESHYSRSDSKKEYPAHDLNICKMYQLYCTKCEEDDVVPVKEIKYRQVFCEDYNFSFYRPKKDQCTLFALYLSKKVNGTVDEDTKKSMRITSYAKQKPEKRKSEIGRWQRKTTDFTWKHLIYKLC